MKKNPKMGKGDYFHVIPKNQDKNKRRVLINIEHLCVHQTINSQTKETRSRKRREEYEGKKKLLLEMSQALYFSHT